jgi:hypothetical protein
MLSPDTTSLEIISIGRLAGDGSRSMDQPSGRAHGQDKERVGSSKALPGKYKASKTEYTNTQQGLPGIGYTLAPN